MLFCAVFIHNSMRFCCIRTPLTPPSILTVPLFHVVTESSLYTLSGVEHTVNKETTQSIKWLLIEKLKTMENCKNPIIIIIVTVNGQKTCNKKVVLMRLIQVKKIKWK